MNGRYAHTARNWIAYWLPYFIGFVLGVGVVMLWADDPHFLLLALITLSLFCVICHWSWVHWLIDTRWFRHEPD